MEKDQDKLQDLVKEKYAGVARGGGGGCAASCCEGSTPLIKILGLGKALAILS